VSVCLSNISIQKLAYFVKLYYQPLSDKCNTVLISIRIFLIESLFTQYCVCYTGYPDASYLTTVTKLDRFRSNFVLGVLLTKTISAYVEVSCIAVPAAPCTWRATADTHGLIINGGLSRALW
jgi:hypothetical protein